MYRKERCSLAQKKIERFCRSAKSELGSHEQERVVVVMVARVKRTRSFRTEQYGRELMKKPGSFVAWVGSHFIIPKISCATPAVVMLARSPRVQLLRFP